MFESIFNKTTTTATISASNALICVGVALLLGLVISGVYILSNKGKNSANFSLTLVLVPPIVAFIIMLIGSDVTKAITLGGVFALVRFRSVPGDSKDISSIFYAMAIGLGCGMGYVTLSVAATFMLGVAYIILARFVFGRFESQNDKQLKITIPEDMNYSDVFDDLFAEFTTRAELVKVKTVNLGTLYQLTYRIRVKNGIDEKKFIDSIRCRNGNLNVMFGMVPEKEAL